MIVWLDPKDCDPPHGLDLHCRHDREKVEALAVAFSEDGFDLAFPALVGYVLEGRVQLLSGTHRHLAAELAEKKIPVTLWRRADVEQAWGTDMWQKLIKDIPVQALAGKRPEDLTTF